MDLSQKSKKLEKLRQEIEEIAYSKQVQVDPEIGMLVWPNEVDFCPDVLYSEATGKPLPELETVAGGAA